MAHINSHDKEFMKTVSEGIPPEAESKDLSLKPIRIAKTISKGIENPKKTLGKAVIKTLLNVALYDTTTKQSSLNVLSLYKFLNEHYERRWWDWEPETIWKMVEKDHFDESAVPLEVKGCIMALQVSLNSFAPFEHWHIFEKIGHAFNLNNVDFSILQPLEPDEIALTMGILSRIRPETLYDSEVYVYIATCAREAGLSYLPQEMFPGVQPYLDNINFDIVLRDHVKECWEKKRTSSDVSEQIQMERLKEIKSYLEKGGLGA